MNTGLIDRNIGKVIKDACRYFSVITLTGPRRSGKQIIYETKKIIIPYKVDK